MIEKHKDSELEALAKITVNRILVQVVGDMPKYKVKDTSKMVELTEKWTPEVKELLIRIYRDFQVLRHASSLH